MSRAVKDDCADGDCADPFEILLRFDHQLPERDVKIHVRLLAGSGTARVRHTITAMPSRRECGGEPFVFLRVAADGTVPEN